MQKQAGARSISIAAGLCALLLLCTVSAHAQVVGDTGETEADVTFIAGELELNDISSFHFKGDVVSSRQQTYNATDAVITLDLSDLRGNGTWKLTATASEFENGSLKLSGAQIKLTGGEANTSGANPNQAKPSVVSNITLDADGAGASTTVATATTSNGKGNWVINWNDSSGDAGTNEKVQLVVPGGIATAGQYTATINWTLVNAE